jgi:hypothetical protein
MPGQPLGLTPAHSTPVGALVMGTHATIGGQEGLLPDPDSPEGRNSHEDHQRIIAAAVDRAVSLQTVYPRVPRSIGRRSRIRGVWKVRGAWRLVAGASDVPAVWLRRLLRQVEEQARPRAFQPNWPSLDPALQRAGYELGVVLRGRGASRPDMTEVFVAGLTSDRHELVYSRCGRLDASHGSATSLQTPYISPCP